MEELAKKIITAKEEYIKQQLENVASKFKDILEKSIIKVESCEKLLEDKGMLVNNFKEYLCNKLRKMDSKFLAKIKEDVKEYKFNFNDFKEFLIQYIFDYQVVKDFNLSQNLDSLFFEKAFCLAVLLEYQGMSSTQFRKFYDKILEISEKAQNSQDFNVEILPSLMILISKAQYSATRGKAPRNFVEIIFKAVNEIKEAANDTEKKEKLINFKLFLESTIGFMRKK